MHKAARYAAEVSHRFQAYDNPQKDLMLTIRDYILSVDARIDECIKWKASFARDSPTAAA